MPSRGHEPCVNLFLDCSRSPPPPYLYPRFLVSHVLRACWELGIYVVLSIVLSIFIEYYYRRLRVVTGKVLAEVGPRSKPNWPWRRQEELVVLSVVKYFPRLKS